ncbi:xylulokinase [Roseobacter sp. YSTF-M11]|uniref:Xylulose kinase n=1 Tax=Roseobacter insulae TaxID=2859783 RepID=A0A9X1FY22_9RHOB|nr:xylulokinase [Roseobacter insulae]MBW4709135.1 xylulokinase [Roseobacter insulae]
MSIFAGVDLGTSGIKVALIDAEGTCRAQASRPCEVDRPHPGWSQQDPDLWWQLTAAIFDELSQSHTGLMSEVAGISLSGQMLGSVLLDDSDNPVAPCLLWNDQRSLAECRTLLERVPDIGWRTNGQPDPGLTAPKLLWMAKHWPDAFDKADILMLPKDYVRLRMTGARASDFSDASGTMMLDCATSQWDNALIEAADWHASKLPELLPSFADAGHLQSALCTRWNMPGTVVVATGCGDNYAGALGVGAALPGDAALSIGTSGVLSAVDDRFRPNPDHAVLTTPHAAPDTYLSMGVVMSATQSLDWLASLTATPAAELAAKAAERVAVHGPGNCPVARPSLTGVRTPDNRPDALAALSGISAVSDKVDLAYAIMEGVAFQFYDAYLAQTRSGVPVERMTAVGGGAKSTLWVQLIATLMETDIVIPAHGDISACIGAAKLAQSAVMPDQTTTILRRKQPVAKTVRPNPDWHDALRERHQRYRDLPFHG